MENEYTIKLTVFVAVKAVVAVAAMHIVSLTITPIEGFTPHFYWIIPLTMAVLVAFTIKVIYPIFEWWMDE